MIEKKQRGPELVVEYRDPLEGFKGWLAIDCFDHELCAGGLRVQKGLTREVIENLASTMTLKMRIAGIRADGAKSGIDYDPQSPGKGEAIYRFLQAIRPFVVERYSIGPDMNTTMPELDAIISRLDIPSIKIAVANAQQLKHEDFIKRIDTLRKPVGHAQLGRLRAGSGLAAACFGAIDYLSIPYSNATVVIQGFGGLASGAAYCLSQAGVKVVGLADREKSLIGSLEGPLNVDELLKQAANGMIDENQPSGIYSDRREIYNVPCDIFVPAAIERSITEEEARHINVRAVVCGANLGVTPEAEKILHDRGILLIPDFVAGCGGSLSMEGLFGPETPPSVHEVIDFVDKKMRNIVKKLLERSSNDKIIPREAAMRLCAETPVYPGTRPYGSPKLNAEKGTASRKIYKLSEKQTTLLYKGQEVKHFCLKKSQNG